mgnify:CR=1 FL=1
MAKKLNNLDKVLLKIAEDVKEAWELFLDDHIDSGRLLKSIKFKIKDHKLVMEIAPEAIFLDEGTRPHTPPIYAIEKWAAHNNINVWALQKHISKFGTKAYPFLDKYKSIYKDAKKEIAAAAKQDMIEISRKALEKNKNRKIKLTI